MLLSDNNNIIGNGAISYHVYMISFYRVKYKHEKRIIYRDDSISIIITRYEYYTLYLRSLYSNKICYFFCTRTCAAETLLNRIFISRTCNRWISCSFPTLRDVYLYNVYIIESSSRVNTKKVAHAYGVLTWMRLYT